MTTQTPKEVWGHVTTLRCLSAADEGVLKLGCEFGADMCRQGYCHYRYPTWRRGQRYLLTQKGAAYLGQMREEYLKGLPLVYGTLAGWMAIVDESLPTAQLISFTSPSKGRELEERYLPTTDESASITNLSFMMKVRSEAGVELTDPFQCWSQEVCKDVGHRMAKCPCPRCKKVDAASPWMPVEATPEWRGYRYICDACEDESNAFIMDDDDVR